MVKVAVNNAPNHSSSARGPRRGLEWSLRSLHKIDTSAQHFLSSYFGGQGAGGDSVGDSNDPTAAISGTARDLEDQTAYEIFKTDVTQVTKDNTNVKQEDSVWASLNAPLRTGVVDGRIVVFELKTNLTQKPKICRKDRLSRRRDIIRSNRSGSEMRLRFWLMHFKVPVLSVSFFVVFLATNVVFAGFFYVTDDGCCDDPEMSYADTLAFCVQTSTTIGYGSMSPSGNAQNALIFLLSYVSILTNTLFAGLLFTKFVTPVIKIQFSDVMTLCNVNGLPCLSVCLGNADGHENPLTDINVSLTCSYKIPYQDHKGERRFFRQTEKLELLSSRQHSLLEVWTLRHVLDESSPLFGMNFTEHPANKIYIFTLSVDAVQELTKCTVNVQTDYSVEDIMIGHSFVNCDFEDGNVLLSDYSKMSETEPYPVWYPAKAGAYDTGERTAPKSFKP